MIVIYIYIAIKVLYYIWKVIGRLRYARGIGKAKDFMLKYETGDQSIHIYLDKETNKLKFEHNGANINTKL